MGTSIHVAAAAHLAAASANFLIYEFSSTPNPIGDELLTAPLHPVEGFLEVPDGPGLGITFDEQKLEAHILGL
jgi:L-alanine-DL-glutamate epimerase-like enolase superfamily enzyme